jgi:hypothetical protein
MESSFGQEKHFSQKKKKLSQVEKKKEKTLEVTNKRMFCKS